MSHRPPNSFSRLKGAPDFKTSKPECLALIIFYLVAGLILLFATFFDREVSSTIMNRSSIVGWFFQNYGTRGPNIVLFVCFQTIAWVTYFARNRGALRWVLTTFFLILAMNQLLLSLNGYFAYTLAVLLNGEVKQVANPGVSQLIWSLLITFGLSIIFYRYIDNRTEEERQYLLRAAVMGIALVFVVSLIIGDLKLHWGRYRPFQMDADMGRFTPWYHPNGSNGHYSFPSGHTTSGWLLLYLPFLLPRSWRTAQKYFVILTVTIAILTALSRVRYGAHWLSDVTAASIIVFSTIFLFSRVLEAHFVKSQPSDGWQIRKRES